MIIRPPEVELGRFAIADIPCNPEPFRQINRIPIRDNGEPLVDLRETNPELSFGDYCLPYVRSSVAEALKIAARHTPEHLDLRVFTALRTLEQQAEMYWHNYRKAKEEHPDWPESVVRKMTNRFFAPPDAKAPPGHCTGGAVDVGLLRRETGEGIDVRSPLDGWKAAPTAVAGLSPDAAENRRLLCFVMHSTGLSNCRDEFWHWSYGDSAWAVRVGADTACYGLVEAPEHATRVIGPKIVLVPYDPAWTDQFASIADSLAGQATRIEHIGSTAVPGLVAQPTLDLALILDDAARIEPTLEELAKRGYVGEGPFWKPQESPTAHRLHVTITDDPALARSLAIRDALRASRSLASDYSALKASLAARWPWDRTRYDEAKSEFLDSVLGSKPSP